VIAGKRFEGLKLQMPMLILLAVFLSGCSGAPERLWLKAPGWDRAQLVGVTYLDSPTEIALNDQEQIFIFVADRSAGQYQPAVICLNRKAEQIWEHQFETRASSINHPKLLWDGDSLHVLWVSGGSLYHSILNPSGEVLANPQPIFGDIQVDSYDAEISPGIGLTVWFTGQAESPGLFAFPPNDLTVPPVLVDPQGLSPDLNYSEDGTLHVIWWHDLRAEGDNRIFYGAYPGGEYKPEHDVVLYEQALRSTDGFDGPKLGIDQSRVYVFWTLSVRTGLEAGKIEASYIQFPLDNPQAVLPSQAISVPRSYDLTYPPVDAVDEPAGPAIALDQPSSAGTSVINNLDVQPVASSEMIIAGRVRIDYLMRKEENQIGIIFLKDGSPTGYQLISFTQADSRLPAIIRDQQGYLYLTWQEVVGDGEKLVYFSSTAADIRESIGGLTGDDLRRMGLDTLFGMLTGALMTPFALIWLIAPLIMLGLTSFTRKESEGLTGRGTLISLALALIGFWVSKGIIMPTMWDYVPFSSWIPIIPEGLKSPLRLGVPIIIALIALAVAWNYTYRRSRNSVLFFTLLYVGLDGILTMAIYGVVILAAI
jgi:hypothetical protein